MTADLYRQVRDEELGKLSSSAPSFRWTDAAALLDDLVLSDEFAEFLTLAAYPLLSLHGAAASTGVMNCHSEGISVGG